MSSAQQYNFYWFTVESAGKNKSKINDLVNHRLEAH